MTALLPWLALGLVLAPFVTVAVLVLRERPESPVVESEDEWWSRR